MAQGQDTATSSKGRKTQRITALTTTHINEWSNALPVLNEGYLYNGIAEQYANDPAKSYITHRPHINVAVPVSGGGGTKGRGVYWWSAKNNKYFMNDNVIYKGDYATPCSVLGGDTAIASGSEKVWFAEWSSANEDYLFIFDPQNDGAYCISSSADTTVINLMDRGSGTGSPFHASDSWDFTDLVSAITSFQLTHGVCLLNGYLFLGMEDGKIYNSNAGDWLNWNALNFLTAERSPDKLFYIGKQQDHVVAVGGASIEVYYDNANATGSPLSARQDIAHRVGTAFAQSCWEIGDVLYFMAIDEGGDFTLCSMEGFQLNYHKNNTMQSYLWMTRYVSDLTMVAEGFSVGGHVYYVLTTLDGASGVISIVYDATTDVWSEWESTVNGQSEFQMIGFMRRAADNDNRPLGMMRNGDMWYPADSKVPTDLVSGGSDVNIPLKSTTGPFDADSTEDKFMHSLNYVGNQSQAALNLTVEWSDDDGVTWVSSTLDLNKRRQINRMGKFVARRFRFTITGTEYIRFEGVDVTFSQGSV